MALLIDKTITIAGNITSPQLYVRFKIDYNVEGNLLQAIPQSYDSKASYDAGDQNSISVLGIPSVLALDYDRAVDGSDILTAAHNKFKEYLSTEIIEDQDVLDPSTGLPTSDPSTGLPITTPVVTKPKLAEASEITLVDID